MKNTKTTFVLLTSLLFFIIIFLGLIISESLFRPVNYFNMGLTRAIELRELAPGLHWMREGDVLVETDENGFVKPTSVYQNPDVSVVFLGGSTTLCKVVDIDKRYPYLTGKLLSDSTKKKINSYNGGVEGNTTLNTINIFLNKVVPMKPDILVIHHNVNGIGKRKILEMDFAFSVRYFTSAFSNLFPVTYSRVKAIIEGTSNIQFRLPEEEDLIYDDTIFKAHLEALIDLARAYSITPVLMTQAANYDTYSYEKVGDYSTIHRENNNIVRAVGKEKDVLVIDLADNFSSSEFLFDNLHYNNKGSVAAARFIADHLKPLIDNMH